MPTNLYSIIALVLYLITLVVISITYSRREALESFSIGSRRIGLLATVASLSSGFRDGAGLAVWVSLAYFFGFGALWLTVGLAVALVALSVSAAAVRDQASSAGYVTVGQLLRDRIGSRTATLSSLAIAGTACLYAAAQLHVSGRILSELLGINVAWAIIFTSVVVAGYLTVGGYRTVIATDVFQWAIIGLILVVPWFLGSLPSFDDMAATATSASWQNALGFAGISFLVVFTSADVWQRVFSARTGATARNGLLLTIPVYFAISAVTNLKRNRDSEMGLGKLV